MKARIAIAVLALSLAPGLPLHAGPEAIDLPALAKKSRAAVLLLSVLDADGKEIATGTGFVISPDGRIVTNHHVIENAAAMVAKGENGAFYKVEGVLAQDATNDIAILKLDASDLPALPLGDSTKAEEGQQVAVIGSPLGLEGTLSDGIISANREADGKRILQISAPISPGSSGSPVLDASGDVIGVASATLTNGQALNLAVPIEAVKSLLPPMDAKPLAFSAPAPKPETQNDPNAALYYDPDLRALLTASIGCDYPKALKLANALVQRYPKSDEALDYQAQAFDKLGFDDDAIASYQNAVKLKPDDEDLWLSLAGEYSETKQWTAALNAAKAAIRLNPEDGMAWSWLGMAQDGLKDYPDAIVSYKRCVKLAPNDSSLLFPLALEYQKTNDLADCLSLWKQAAQRMPKDQSVRTGLAEAYLAIGLNDDAINNCKTAIRLDPKDGDSWSLLAVAYINIKKYDAAALAVENAVKIDPKDGFPWWVRGCNLCIQKQYPEAITALNQATKLAPHAPQPWRELAKVYCCLGRATDAENANRKAEALESEAGCGYDQDSLTQAALNFPINPYYGLSGPALEDALEDAIHHAQGKR